ncbi:unnamed protein product [Dimorphilus gyrociliatus]|uniref:Uncharacterized protein n=1 Tax=Dimorphilus gyrociliatus TaxID=2664684 RepID=A0A7I8VQS2_9ANNE|nr:unnamed protein product [Dimorphilus gyrociliatus]
MGNGLSRDNPRLVILGLDSAGKSTVLYRLKFDQYVDNVPTVGFNLEKIRSSAGRSKGTVFQVWDVGGQEKTRSLWKSYSRSADGVLFVVDSADEERLEEARMELHRFANLKESLAVPIMVLANKQDLPSALSADQVGEKLNLNRLPQSKICDILEICAVTGDGLESVFDGILELVTKRRRQLKQKKDKSFTTLFR